MIKQLHITFVVLLSSVSVFGQDSIVNARMVETIDQSLLMFYNESASATRNVDSVREALSFETSDIPTYSDAVYCDRLDNLNEMSPFHLDCNEATLKTIKFFAEKRRGFIKVCMGRSELYFDMFEEKLDDYGLPIELKYLAVIESGLRPQVKSRAGACGLWQFMYRTGRMFGLEQNSYVDERMDPEKATDAACQYLKKLYGMYDDWNLALAAYNAGPGNVNKAIRRSGNKKTYWEVRPFLPRETQGYVPNFIAAAYMINYYQEHNIVPEEATIKYYELDTMCLHKGVHMETISDLLEISLEDIQRLNPIYKRNYIPKGVDELYCVTLPLDEIGKLVSLEDSLYALELEKYETPTVEDPSTPTQTASTSSTKTYAYHKVKSGETLGTIASKYKTTVSELQQLNGLSSSRIYVGQRLKVKATAMPTTTTTTTNTTNSGNRQYYSVRSGDTFGRIAQRYGTSISQLRRLNPGINIDRLSIGQKIRVK
ncbi:LysM peptidoglycan-binding domain-containing protein [Crocinitomicaceae bacterium]|nr:LysM peptidoglycan-binding domain-containing protein [Crocinitomicaceae bacterium]